MTSDIRQPDWWDELLFNPQLSTRELRFSNMLRVIAYDISDPRRLRRVAKVCEAFGARVQLSVFECWLDGDRFDQLVASLREVISPSQDQIVLYTLDAQAAKRRTSLGARATFTERTGACLVL